MSWNAAKRGIGSALVALGVNAAVLGAIALACKTERRPAPRAAVASAADDAVIVVDAPDVPPVEKAERIASIASVPVDGDVPVLVARGRSAEVRAVFLGGACTHPRAALEVLRRAASEHGTIVALQGDVPCPETKDPTLRKFSTDTQVLEKRIAAAVGAVGGGLAPGATLVGYSQGAERAEWLANRGGETFTRFVLVASPITPEPARFGRAEGVVAMAGPGDVRENMAIGARRLRRASIPAVYTEIPSHGHSELDPAAAEALAGAFEWLEANARPREDRRPPMRKAMLQRR